MYVTRLGEHFEITPQESSNWEVDTIIAKQSESSTYVVLSIFLLQCVSHLYLQDFNVMYWTLLSELCVKCWKQLMLLEDPHQASNLSANDNL